MLHVLSSLAICDGIVVSHGPSNAFVTVTATDALTEPTEMVMTPLSGMKPAVYDTVDPEPVTTPDVSVYQDGLDSRTTLSLESYPGSRTTEATGPLKTVIGALQP